MTRERIAYAQKNQESRGVSHTLNKQKTVGAYCIRPTNKKRENYVWYCWRGFRAQCISYFT